MDWLFYAIATGLFYTGLHLLTRHVLKAGKDAWAFSFYFSFVGTVISFPFMLANPVFPSWQTQGWMYGLTILTAFLIVGHNWLEFQARKLISASLSGTISKFRLVWVLLIGVLLLGESISAAKITGTVLTIISGWLLVIKFKKIESLRGFGMTFLATVIYGLLTLIVKTALASGGYNAPTATFFLIFLGPTIVNFILMPQAVEKIKALYKDSGKWVLAACSFGAFANLTLTQAFSLGEASRVVVLVEAFLITTLVGEHIWLKEKEHLFIKIVAVALAIIGAWLIVK